MKKYTSFLTLFVFAVLMLTMPSCTSVEKLVDNGDYDQTIRLAQKRLTGKQKKNPKYVAALETAVNRAIERDMNAAQRLKNAPDTDWTRVRSLYAKIDRRQQALEPLLPLMDKHGRQAQFQFARVAPLIAEANQKAAAQLFAEATQLLADGRQGNKAAARDAYSVLGDIDSYIRGYRNANALRQEARELGKVFIAVEMVNRSGGYLPAGFEQELLRVQTSNMDSKWRFFDFQRQAGKAYDYNAQIVIDDIRVSPERVSERAYIDEKEITDGEEYVLDANGNVAKDTLGNDITRPRQIIVRADILEVLQTKSALVSGRLLLFDNTTRRVVDEDELTAEAIFENYASTYRGDRRALNSDTRRYIGNRPQPFPSNEALILDAADRLKPILQARLADSYQAR